MHSNSMTVNLKTVSRSNKQVCIAFFALFAVASLLELESLIAVVAALAARVILKLCLQFPCYHSSVHSLARDLLLLLPSPNQLPNSKMVLALLSYQTTK